jgi:hypothetical protein
MSLRLTTVAKLAVPLIVACSDPPSQSEQSSTVETCDDGVRNEDFDLDCSAACNHVLACKAVDNDSDIAELSCGDCLGSCLAGVSLGGNDVVEGTDENRQSWVCAALVEGCHALDHNCDIY